MEQKHGRSRLPSSILAAALVLATSVQAQRNVRPEDPSVPDVCAPLGGACVDPLRPLQLAPGTIPPARFGPGFLVFPNTRVAANGVGLRDVASGGIDLVGVPPGSTVVAAYLYWCWISLGAPTPGLHDTMSIARVPRISAPGLAGAGVSLGLTMKPVRYTGTLVGSGPDPCWNGGANFVYRADVTASVTRGDSFVVWLSPGAAGQQNYRDPWAFPFPIGPHCEGASLVVVYTNTTEFMGTTHIYDSGLSGNMFHAWPGTGYFLSGFFYPGGEARWINVGADGQAGAGYQELHSMGLETTLFNGIAIAGPGSLTDSDWNGAGNKPLGGLWDTSGHDVSAMLGFGSTIANIQVSAPPPATITDCLVPVCNVLWMR
jgi:hypothetical protein